MSKYSKSQERRLEKHLNKLPGVEVIKYYGNREKNRGDFLVRKGGQGGQLVRIEHKSTENLKAITINKEHLLKTIGACLRLNDEEGMAHPLVTFSIKYCPQIYTWSWYNFGSCVKTIEMKHKSLTLTLDHLDLFEDQFIRLDMDGSTSWIHRLEYWFASI